MDGRKLTEELRKATRAQSDARNDARTDGRAVDAGDEGDEADDASPGGAPGQGRNPYRWFPVVILAVLVLGGFYVVKTLQADSKLQDCVMSGRKNCAPVDTDTTPGAPVPR